ncbi:hypothetical protein L6164_015407 [Bauhinia variegata]|uniref:Uncharacterized protein n=1 Tax=Bauhinia variegata TaxID=167791 RepID=A0ACB9NKK7_BAUVA|nr:hypothetical protein L6164_015407 [Bauhinia variegata]
MEHPKNGQWYLEAQWETDETRNGKERVADSVVLPVSSTEVEYVRAVMEGLENIAFVANAVSLVSYFFGYEHHSDQLNLQNLCPLPACLHGIVVQAHLQ